MTFPTTTLPAIRSAMGVRHYYITTMRFDTLATVFKPNKEIHTNERLQDWIQRELDGRRVGEIAEYLKTQQERFFNAIIGGIYGGEPQWYGVDVGRSRTVDIELDERTKRAMGILQFNGDELIFAIDGQHRVEAIKKAIAADPALAKEEQAVIFIGHERTEAGMERTRRLFSTLNRNARAVSLGEIIALDEDDAFAIATRRLLEEVSVLSNHRIYFGKGLQLPAGDATSLSSILCVHEIAKTLYVSAPTPGQRNVRIKKLTVRRPADDVLDSIVAQSRQFWELLSRTHDAVRAVAGGEERDRAAAPFRNAEGGHALLRPIGQQALALATRTLMDRGAALEDAITQLSRVRVSLTETPWVGTAWDPQRRKIIGGRTTLCADLLLIALEKAPTRDLQKVLQSYRKVLGDDSAELPRSCDMRI